MAENADEQFMPVNYEMDPELEDLLSSGHQLCNGMEVLIEDPMFRYKETRERPIEALEKYYLERAMRYARWSRVSELRIRNNVVTFVATYHDGTKKKIAVSTFFAWYVKKLSVAAALEQHPGRKAFEALVGDLRKIYGPMLNQGDNPVEVKTPEYEVKPLHSCRDNGCTIEPYGPVHFNADGDVLVGDPEYLSRLTEQGMADMEAQAKKIHERDLTENFQNDSTDS